MYVPSHFAEDDRERLIDLMQRNGFALLISNHEGRPFATHLPLLYRSGPGECGRLLGHVARANPHWQALAADPTVLAVFQGPHAYVSPTWYAQPGVPTWNYAAVHAYGHARLIEDHDEFRELLRALTAVYEAASPEPWQMEQAGDLPERMMKAIVGFEIEITELQGKYKLSQNRSAADRDNVVRHLSESSDATARATARLMRETGT